jgi:hypothetical protein
MKSGLFRKQELSERIAGRKQRGVLFLADAPVKVALEAEVWGTR